MFHMISKNFYLLVAQVEKSDNHQNKLALSTGHHGYIDQITCSCWDISNFKWWTNEKTDQRKDRHCIHRDMLLAWLKMFPWSLENEIRHHPYPCRHWHLYYMPPQFTLFSNHSLMNYSTECCVIYSRKSCQKNYKLFCENYHYQKKKEDISHDSQKFSFSESLCSVFMWKF